jgi:phosphoribulokinase
MTSPVTSTRLTLDSTLTAVLIPSLDDVLFVFLNQDPDVVQFPWRKSMIPRQF